MSRLIECRCGMLVPVKDRPVHCPRCATLLFPDAGAAASDSRILQFEVTDAGDSQIIESTASVSSPSSEQ